MRVAILAAGAILAAASGAQAGEIQFGAGPSGHDLVLRSDPGDKEGGYSVTGTYVFDTPEIIRWSHARPYVGATLSLSGYTNFINAGLLWRLEGEHAYGEFGAGVATHDGELELPYPEVGLPPEVNAQRAADLLEFNEYGSRVLAHFVLSAGYRVTEDWAVEVSAQHWSSGRLGDSDKNDGADILALRAARRF